MNNGVTVEQMRAIDANAASLGMPVYLMMENAGNALVRYMAKGLGDLHEKKVVVVCGLSNNGGGGIASAKASCISWCRRNRDPSWQTCTAEKSGYKTPVEDD